MGCGTSYRSRENNMDDEDMAIIHEHNMPYSPSQAACKPHQVKRLAPSMVSHMGLSGHQGELQYQSLLRTMQPEEAHIVVVDDDSTEMLMVIEWFQETGYSVTACCNGEEAQQWVATVTKGLDAGEKLEGLNLVLTDQHMSTDSMSVLEVIHSNAHCKDIPVVVCGGEVSSQQAERIIRRGAADFVFKPMSRALLLKTVRVLLQNIVETENTSTMKRLGDKNKVRHKTLKRQLKPHQVPGGSKRNSSFSSALPGSSLPGSSIEPRSREEEEGDNDTMAEIPKANVLIIGTDPETNKQLSLWLNAKYEVTVCTTSTEALEKLIDEDEIQFNLVLSEAQLEGQVSGLDMLEKIHAHDSNMPFILISLEDTPTTEMTNAVRNGCENYITKPLAKELTTKKVDTILLAIAQHELCKQHMERAQKYERMIQMLEQQLESKKKD